MIHYFFLTAGIILFNHFFLQYQYVDIFTALVDFTNQFELTILAYSITGSVSLIFLSYCLTSIGLFRPIYFISKTLLRGSQFLLVFLSAANILFWFQLQHYLLPETGFILMVTLWVIMICSCLAIRAIDFNYHIRSSLIPGILWPILSEIIVQLTSLFFS